MSVCIAATFLIGLHFSRDFLTHVNVLPQPHSHGTSMGLHECPFGHTTLRDVPISYGLMVRSPEVQAAVDGFEMWPGGCVRATINGVSEDTKVVCTTCTYAYECYMNYWEKHSDSSLGFSMPLTSFVASFPVFGSCSDTFVSRVTYYQRVRDGAVVGEQLVYWSNSDSAALVSAVRSYMRSCGYSADSTAITGGQSIFHFAAAGTALGCVVNVESADSEGKYHVVSVELYDPIAQPWRTSL